MAHIDPVTLSMLILGGTFFKLITHKPKPAAAQKVDEELLDFYFRLGNHIPSAQLNRKLKEVEARVARFHSRS